MLYIYMSVLLFLIWASRTDLPSIKQRPNKQLTHPIIPKIYWASWALRKDVDLLLAFRSMYRVIYLSARSVPVFILCDIDVFTFYPFIYFFLRRRK